MTNLIRKTIKRLIALSLLLALGQALAVFAAPPLQPPDPLGALRAASEETPVVTINHKTGVADFMSAAVPTSGDSADARSRSFLKSHGALFGVSDPQNELSVMRTQNEAAGMSHVVYEQQYRGVPVFGARLVVHLDRAGRVTATNGQFQPGIALGDVSPTISGDDARAIAQKAIGASSIEWQQAPRLVIWTHNAGGVGARLTWEVAGFANQPLGRWHYFIDAHSGDVAYQLNELDTAENRTVYNESNSTTLPGTLVCTEGTPGSCSDTDSQDAFNFTGTTYSFYFNNFARDSVDGAGLELRSSIHYSTNYNNAFWNGSQMVYGDGDGVVFVVPLNRDLDVVAHELTHGVTQYTSALFYQDQSGALNESYSDVFAVFVNPANWTIGEVSYEDHAYGLRSLADPTKGGQWDPNNPYGSKGQPDSMSNIAVLPTQLDNGGVHINSGIPNHVAYLITNGGTFGGITVTGIGFAKARQIYYRTQTVYNTPFTTFSNAANNTYRACRDLIGQFSIVPADCNSVQNGWAAVGVGPSASQNQKLYLPLSANNFTDPNPGIYGHVTNNGVAAAGVSLSLYRCTQALSGCSVPGSTSTDANGDYRFTGVATLPAGLVYLVLYKQPGTLCTLWNEWDGSSIDQYTSSQSRQGGNFDLRPIPLVSPAGNVSGASQSFTWGLRTLPAGMLRDYPRLIVYNGAVTSVVFVSSVLARGTTSYGPVSGFALSTSYLWTVRAYAPGGVGYPECGNTFTRTASPPAPSVNPSGVPVVLPSPDTKGIPRSLAEGGW